METYQNIQKSFTDICNRLQRIEEKIGNPRLLKHDWLDHQEICQRLHISKRTLDNYREQGLLPFSKIGGKVFYRLEDIDDFLNSNIRRIVSR